MQAHQVKSAMRALEILEYFKVNQQRRSMSEIASDLGYPQSSATVLLKTLITLGYLSYDRGERAYFPTPKVTALGDWIPMALFGSGTILEAMRDVHAATGEGVFIGTRNDIYLQYTRTVESIHALRFHIDEGSIVPLTRSAAGWMLLSDLPRDRLDKLVRRANIACKVPERVSLKEIEARIAEIREKGYAHAENVPLEGGSTIVVPLCARIQGQPACLALGGVTQRINDNFDRYLSIMKTAAAFVAEAEPFNSPIRIEI
ncbi:IclR family transcriptional regulator [Falsigemmobacter faecalis]|uniref:Transcriptional regulator n=1 Tax=Falsigemmobacter faecalis TaxID=2488730 RepID=A0A3P3DFE5_9RHOB|nr:helix-turn-helix domain-containing protein [Falsigemmobacter faecalis]RRH73011.1 transcriptional regulator [Falsigemmobacter faecalis]